MPGLAARAQLLNPLTGELRLLHTKRASNRTLMQKQKDLVLDPG